MRASSWRPPRQFALPSFPPSTDDAMNELREDQFMKWSLAWPSPPTKIPNASVIARLSRGFLPHRQFGFSPFAAHATCAGPVPASRGLSARAPSPPCSSQARCGGSPGHPRVARAPAAPCHPHGPRAVSSRPSPKPTRCGWTRPRLNRQASWYRPAAPHWLYLEAVFA